MNNEILLEKIDTRNSDTSHFCEVKCFFLGSFKVGDNLEYNAEILCECFKMNDSGKLNKLIVLQSASIIETALQQIIFRAKQHNREGVPNMSEQDRNEIEKKKIERFAAILDVMKKYKILDRLGADIYGELDILRKIRNKVHIHESLDQQIYSRDEADIFTSEMNIWAVKLLHRVLEGLNQYYRRAPHIAQWASVLRLPKIT